MAACWIAVVICGCGCGCGEDRPEPRFERVDISARFGSGGAGPLRIGSGETASTTIEKVRPFTRLFLEPVGEAGGSLEVHVAGLDDPGSTLSWTVPVRPRGGKEMLDLGSLQGRRVSVTLRVPPSSPPVELATCALLVQDRPPNVVLIVIDTLRADCFMARRKDVDTPQIDRLAGEGVPFTRAFAHAPMTLPAHTALFSSRHPFETGVLCNYQDVPGDLPLLAEHLADHGYATKAVVSLGTLWPRKRSDELLDRGFDSYTPVRWGVSPANMVFDDLRRTVEDLDPLQPFFLFAHFSDPHEPYNAHGTIDHAATIYVDGEQVETVTTADATQWEHTFVLSPGKHELAIRSERNLRIRSFDLRVDGDEAKYEFIAGGVRQTRREVVAMIENPGDGPQAFVCKMWISDTPPRRKVPPRYLKEVEFADRYVGELLDVLREKGLYEQSVIVFTSDHGEALGERGFAGHVIYLHDELLHVPLIFRLPEGLGGIDELRVNSERVVAHLDVVPTLLDLLDLPALPGQRGKSLLLDLGQRVVISETHEPEAPEDQISIRDRQLKLIYHPEGDRFEMFDLLADKKERFDVFAERGEERLSWQEQLRRIATIAASGERIDFEDLPAADRERLKAIGY